MNASRALLASSLLSAAIASLAPASAAAAPELVSRATGADGAAFSSGVLTTATRDGRFVLFLGPYNEAASAEPDSRRTLFLRDRVANTTTPVLRADGEFGVVWFNENDWATQNWVGRDVSDDGTKVLFSGPRQGGATGTALYVRDLTAKTTTVVSTLPSGDEASELVGIARFINGGTGILFGAEAGDGTPSTYTRALPAGPSELFAAGVAPRSATARGDVITWRRPLLPATRPAGSGGNPAGWPASYAGFGVGYTIKGQAPVLTARTIVRERPATAASCETGAASWDRLEVADVRVPDAGTRVWMNYTGSNSSFSSNGRNDWSLKTATADLVNTSIGGDYGKSYRRLVDLGETGEQALALTNPGVTGTGPYVGTITLPGLSPKTLPELPYFSSIHSSDTARFFAGDTGVLTSEADYPRGGPVTQGVYAYAPVAEPTPTPEPTTPVAVDGEVADSPSVTAEVLWASCPTLPIGTASQYAQAQYNTPFTSSKSAGTVTVSGAVDGIRQATKTTITIKTFGWTTWSKTISGSGATPTPVALPNPWLWFPQSLTIDTEIAGTNGAPATHLKQTRRWQAWR